MNFNNVAHHDVNTRMTEECMLSPFRAVSQCHQASNMSGVHCCLNTKNSPLPAAAALFGGTIVGRTLLAAGVMLGLPYPPDARGGGL